MAGNDDGCGERRGATFELGVEEPFMSVVILAEAVPSMQQAAKTRIRMRGGRGEEVLSIYIDCKHTAQPGRGAVSLTGLVDFGQQPPL